MSNQDTPVHPTCSKRQTLGKWSLSRGDAPQHNRGTMFDTCEGTHRYTVRRSFPYLHHDHVWRTCFTTPPCENLISYWCLPFHRHCSRRNVHDRREEGRLPETAQAKEWNVHANLMTPTTKLGTLDLCRAKISTESSAVYITNHHKRNRIIWTTIHKAQNKISPEKTIGEESYKCPTIYSHIRQIPYMLSKVRHM